MAPDLKSSDQWSFSRPRSQLRYQEQSLVRWFVVMKRQRAQAAHRARHACAAACAETDACAESAQLPSEPPVQSPSPGRVTPQKPDDALRSQASASVERCARSGRIPPQRGSPPTHRSSVLVWRIRGVFLEGQLQEGPLVLGTLRVWEHFEFGREGRTLGRVTTLKIISEKRGPGTQHSTHDQSFGF